VIKKSLANQPTTKKITKKSVGETFLKLPGEKLPSITPKSYHNPSLVGMGYLS
jgi:hypothetical protein